jgi:hypothetical protein
VLLLPGLLLIKDISMSSYSKAWLMFFALKLTLSSDMSMRIYSVAGIAERPLLAAAILLRATI